MKLPLLSSGRGVFSSDRLPHSVREGPSPPRGIVGATGPFGFCGNSGSGFCNDRNLQRCSYTCDDGYSWDKFVNCPERGRQVTCPPFAYDPR